MRGQQETFNPQIHTEALSLSVNQEKDNAIHKASINRFSRYSQFTSILFSYTRSNQRFLHHSTVTHLARFRG